MFRKLVIWLVVVPLAIIILMFAIGNRQLVTVSFDPFSSTEPAASGVPVVVGWPVETRAQPPTPTPANNKIACVATSFERSNMALPRGVPSSGLELTSSELSWPARKVEGAITLTE